MGSFFPRYYWPVIPYSVAINTLFDAIRARYEATPFVDTITELYNTEAGDKAVLPYCVFSLPSNVADNFASDKAFVENNLVQFALYSEAALATEILAAYNALKSAFDFETLAIVPYTTLSCVREGTIQTRVEKVWRIYVNYRIKLK